MSDYLDENPSFDEWCVANDLDPDDENSYFQYEAYIHGVAIDEGDYTVSSGDALNHLGDLYE